MLKFISKHKSGFGGTGLSGNNISAKESQKIADQMNQRDLGLKCNLHPNSISIISVDVLVKPMFGIESICCFHFKQMVEKYFGIE